MPSKFRDQAGSFATEQAFLSQKESSSCFQASLGVAKYRIDLGFGDTGEPFNKIRDRGAIFEVLEQSRNRDARSRENPSAAHRFW
jgi:hypothetical protein